MSAHDDPEAQLDLDRNRNNQKLKSRFEHIFRKYEHDFTGIGDEFDIHTDQIVVNNGHLEHMRNEADSGTTASSHFVKTFREKLAHEDEPTASQDEEEDDEEEDDEEEDDEEEDDEEEDDDEDDGSDSGSGQESDEADAFDMSRSARTTPAMSRPHKGRTGLNNQSSLGPSKVVSQHAPRLPQLFRLLAGEGTLQDPLEVPDDEDTGDDSVSATTSRNQTASIFEPLHDYKHSSSAESLARGKRPTANNDTVEALGMSIATQLAKLMGASSRKKSRRKATIMHGTPDPVWDYPELNQTKRTKRKRTMSPVAQPQRSSSPHTTSPEGRSLWAVHESAQPGKRKRRADASNALRPTIPKSSNPTDLNDSKRCWNCSLTRSLDWRKGPHGQDLCLPCGEFYEHHGRMKGFDSATPPMIEQDQSAHTTTDNIENFGLGTNKDDSLVLSNATGPGQYEQRLQHTDRRSHDRTPEFMPKLEEDEPTDSDIPYQANTSRLMVTSPSKRKATRWTVEEDALLIRLKECDHLSWEDIALHFPSRATFAIQKTYSSRLRGVDCPGRKLFNAQLEVTVDDVETGGEREVETKVTEVTDSHDLNWSPQQDELLVALRDVDELEWSEIADLLPGHGPKAVKRRYALLSARKQPTADLRNCKIEHSNHASASLAKTPQAQRRALPTGLPRQPHARHSLPTSIPPSSRRSGSGNALLRQAIGNSQRHRSYTEAVPVRAPSTQSELLVQHLPASKFPSRRAFESGESSSSADARDAESLAVSLQLRGDVQRSRTHNVGGDGFDQRVTIGAHQARLHSDKVDLAPRNEFVRAASKVSSRSRRRRASRADSADAEHDAREALENSCGDEGQVSESTTVDESLGLARPPDLSWSQIVDMAFASTPNMSMSNQDLFAWIESNFGYYSTAPRGWKNYVREELRANHKYEVDTVRRRNSVWRVRQEMNNHVHVNPQVGTDLLQEPVTDDTVEAISIFDNGDMEVFDSTPFQQTSQSGSRHVSFSPVVTVSTPVPVQRRQSHGRPQKRGLSPALQNEQPLAMLEIPDSDRSDDSGALASSLELANNYSNSAVPVAASAGQASQPSSDVSRNYNNSSPPPLLRCSPAGSTRKSPASLYKTPVQPSRSRFVEKKSLSDSARRHSTPIINHRFATPNAGTRKRVVETPLRELEDPNEDELAG